MPPNVALPLLASALSVLFWLTLLDQYVQRRRPYKLAWLVGLALLVVATGSEAAGNHWGWSHILYRLWYLSGALSVAAWLGTGTIYLLAPGRVAHRVLLVFLLTWVLAAARVLTADVDVATLRDGLLEGGAPGRGFPSSVRLMTPFFNLFGAAALVGGALWSAYSFWRRRRQVQRVVSNVLIAAGALVISLSSGLSRFGVTDLYYVGELVGIAGIFAGFCVTSEVFAQFRIPFTKVVLGRRAEAGG